jgi:beta-mannosidase
LTNVELSEGWQLASSTPGACFGPSELDGMEWIAAPVPGTAAAALREAGLWRAGEAFDFDARDWWFRTRFEAEPAGEGEEVGLALDGIATVSEVYLNGDRVLAGDSMFASHRVEVSSQLRSGASGGNELAICCRALAPLLRGPRRPRARWRTRLVSDGNLRFYRTMLLGRAPGFAPGPACVGPWKPIRLERHRGVVLDELIVRSRLVRDEGRLTVRGRLRRLAAAARLSVSASVSVSVELSGPNGTHRAELSVEEADGVRFVGELTVPDVARWWPHTHGAPALHEVGLVVRLGEEELGFHAGRVGFRDLHTSGELDADGIQLRINGVPVFARGAVWTPLDLALPGSRGPALDEVLGTVVDAGMNMLRVPGIGCYESPEFYDRCDERGILVWQDFMFANLDYPEQDAGFMRTVGQEARQVLAALGSRASLAVLCGGSEVAQQVAMMGLDPKLAETPLYQELLPSLIAEAEAQAAYVPSAPWGGDLPFRPDRGVANYYGVGAYLRPLEDARRSEVKFAAESLAFSNVPDEESLEAIDAPGGLVVHHPSWKAGVPRDAGAGWDFEDVRDHYLRVLFDVDPVVLRSTEHDRYLDLSRQLTGEVMAEVLGEWRRAASPCGGALVLWLTDLMPGAGWGLLASDHRPKVAYHHVRRALAPVAVWSTDEGLGGIVAHIANDRPQSLRATLRVSLYRDLEVPVEEVREEVVVEPHGMRADNVEELLGRFVDVSWSYRFGAPAQDLVVLSLQHTDETRPLSHSFRFPAGRPPRVETAAQLGVCASLAGLDEDSATVTVQARRLAYGVRIRVPGFVASDDAFAVEPGHSRVVELRRAGGRPGHESPSSGGYLTALNLAGRVSVETEAAQ